MSDRTDTDSLEKILMMSLVEACTVHDRLGEKGLETVQTNSFGDTALRADVEIEDAIIALVRNAAFHGFHIYSEEHGVVALDDEKPQYIGVLDGLDGTAVYKDFRSKGRYGTMFGILKGSDPAYADYVVCGIAELAAQKLFLGVKGKGVFVFDHELKTALHTSACTAVQADTRIYFDDYGIVPDFFGKILRLQHLHHAPVSRISSAVHYADLVAGKVDLVLECTRKNNLEIAVAYGLIIEAGGVMVDAEGVDIGLKKYLEFGQHEQVPLIAASTLELAQASIRMLR